MNHFTVEKPMNYERLIAYGKQQAPEKQEALFQEYMNIHGWCALGEGRRFYNYVRNPKVNGCVVEIGSFKGLSTMFLAAGAKEAGCKVYAVDPHPPQVALEFNGGKPIRPEFQANIDRFGFQDIIVQIVKTSEDAVKLWDMPIKLLYVDGEHTYDAVMKDYAWTQYVAPGGVISYDDSGKGSEVWRAMNDTIRKNSDFTEFDAANSWFVRSGNEWWNS